MKQHKPLKKHREDTEVQKIQVKTNYELKSDSRLFKHSISQRPLRHLQQRFHTDCRQHLTIKLMGYIRRLTLTLTIVR